MASASPATSALRLRWTAGATKNLEQADVILLIGANIADNHPISAGAWRRMRGDADRRRSPRNQDGMMSDVYCRSAALGHRARQRIMHILIAPGS